ncbi:MAG: hypothetical protein WAT70_01670, partial [Rhizobiaceae bacterium]
MTRDGKLHASAGPVFRILGIAMNTSVLPVLNSVLSIAPESSGDTAARDRLLDRAMASNWRRKASEKLLRGRLPAIALV